MLLHRLAEMKMKIALRDVTITTIATTLKPVECVRPQS